MDRFFSLAYLSMHDSMPTIITLPIPKNCTETLDEFLGRFLESKNRKTITGGYDSLVELYTNNCI